MEVYIARNDIYEFQSKNISQRGYRPIEKQTLHVSVGGKILVMKKLSANKEAGWKVLRGKRMHVSSVLVHWSDTIYDVAL